MTSLITSDKIAVVKSSVQGNLSVNSYPNHFNMVLGELRSAMRQCLDLEEASAFMAEIKSLCDREYKELAKGEGATMSDCYCGKEKRPGPPGRLFMCNNPDCIPY